MLLHCPIILPNCKKTLYTFVFQHPCSAAALPAFQIEMLKITFLITQAVWAVVFVSRTVYCEMFFSFFFFLFNFLDFKAYFNSLTKGSISRDSLSLSVSLFWLSLFSSNWFSWKSYKLYHHQLDIPVVIVSSSSAAPTSQSWGSFTTILTLNTRSNSL